MNDEYLTEEQEAERAKQWVRENGLFIVAGVVLGLGGLFGWQQWEDAETAEAEKASAVWVQMRSAIEGERYNEVDETLAILEDEYAGSAYLDQARLAMAALSMSRNDPEAAMESLERLINEGSDEQLIRIAELRLAQILISEQRYDDALARLGDGEDSGLSGLADELRGDALYYKGDFAAAAEAYQASLDNDSSGVIDRSYVQIKLDATQGEKISSDAVVADDVAEEDAEQEE